MHADDTASTELETGTTVVGLVADEAVVLATDRRSSLGSMVASKSAEKAVRLSDRAAMAYSGSVSGAQALTSTLRADVSLYETRRNTRMSAEALATLVSTTLREQQFGVMPVVGVVDPDTADPRLFSYDGAGGRSEESFTAVGSGAPYAFGHLEEAVGRLEDAVGRSNDAVAEGLSVEAATDIALDAVRVASERDLASGNGYNVATVTAGGVEVESRPAS